MKKAIKYITTWLSVFMVVLSATLSITQVLYGTVKITLFKVLLLTILSGCIANKICMGD